MYVGVSYDTLRVVRSFGIYFSVVNQTGLVYRCIQRLGSRGKGGGGGVPQAVSGSQ